MKKNRSRVERWRVYALMGVMLFVFALLVGCGASYPPPIVDYDATGVYPGATEVVTHEVQVAWRLPGIEQYRTIDFRTSDSPDVVLDYFNKALSHRGWAISGCQGAERSLTFVWIHPYGAMEIVEIVTEATTQSTVEVRFAKHTYGSMGPMWEDFNKAIEEDEVVQRCMGVYGGDSGARNIAGMIGYIVVGLIILLHISLSAWAWRGYTPVSLWGFIAVGFMTTLLWMGFFGIAEISIWIGAPSYARRSDAAVTRTGDLYRLIYESPVQYVVLLIGITWTGIMLKEPLENGLRAWRMRRASKKKPRTII